MIITNRPAAHSFSPDPIATSLRTFIAPTARLSASQTEAGLAPAGRRDDFARLYPALFAREARVPARSRAARAAAVAIASAGSVAAAFMAILHK